MPQFMKEITSVSLSFAFFCLKVNINTGRPGATCCGRNPKKKKVFSEEFTMQQILIGRFAAAKRIQSIRSVEDVGEGGGGSLC